MLKLAIGCPAYHSQISSGHLKMWLQVGAALARGKDKGEIDPVMIADVDVTGIDKARNILLKAARDAGADWLLMIDADTWVSSGVDLIRMIQEAPVDAAIIGAPVRIREGNAGSHSGVNVFRHHGHGKYSVLTDLSVLDLSEPVFPVDAIGAAVMAINLLRIGDSTFRFENGVSEDLRFCEQVTALGGSIYADARVTTFHVARPKVLTCASNLEIDRAGGK